MCVARSSMRSRGHSLLRLVLPIVSFILAGSREGWGGVPANEDPVSIMCKRTRCICPGPESGQLGDATTLSFTFTSFRATPFLVSGTTGPKPAPLWIISFVFCMPFLVSGILWYQIFVSSHFHHLPHHLHPPRPPAAGEDRAGPHVAARIQTSHHTSRVEMHRPSKCVF